MHSLTSDSNGPPGADPVAMMEYYMKRAAQEEQKRQPKQSKDEMPPPDSLQGLTFSPLFKNSFCYISIN